MATPTRSLTSSPLVTIADAVLQNIVGYVPHELIGVYKTGKAASNGPIFARQYLRDLQERIGSDEVEKLVGRLNQPNLHSQPRKLVDTLTQDLYKRLRTIPGGEEKLIQIKAKGIIASSHFADLAKWMQQEEDRNLLSICSRLFGEDVWTRAKSEIDPSNLSETELQSTLAKTARRMIENLNQKQREAITNLDLSHLSLSSIPKEVFLFSNLQTLSLSHNRLREIPPEIKNLTKLQGLYLGYNQIKVIPSNVISHLTNLINLDINHNQINTIPSEIGNLTQLTRLYLNYNKIESIPSEIKNLTNLQRLGLVHNHIKVIPSEIGNLKQLTWLNLEDNQIEEIPREITSLNELQWLILTKNRIASISPIIRNFLNNINFNC